MYICVYICIMYIHMHIYMYVYECIHVYKSLYSREGSFSSDIKKDSNDLGGSYMYLYAYIQ
jgi:hypothetical protein